MSAAEVIAEISKLPMEEQKQVFVFLTETFLPNATPANPKPWLGRKLSFEEACEVVFKENRELLSLLAK